MKIERRRFVGLMLGATSGAAVGLSAGHLLAKTFATADSPYDPPGGIEEFRLSVCSLCPGGCGVRVRCIAGRPVKLDGNPRHPVSGGRLCPKGQAALQALYHPDRIPGPMRRKGERGSLASFEKRTWEEAFTEIGGRLRSIREQGKPESVALLRAGAVSLGARVGSRFLSAFGSPNEVRLDRGDEAASIALRLTQGVKAVPVYDLPDTDYVLSLGSGLLEASGSPVASARAFGEFRQVRTGRRGKFVQVESRLSLTGAAADEWIAVHPGTEGIFALGIASVLVNEDLYDRDFIADHAAGFESGPTPGGKPGLGLRTLLERDFGLERVAAETGVSVNVILRVARELHAARASLVVGPRRGPLLPGSLFDHLAAQALNALVGNIDGEGGLLVAEETPIPTWPELPAKGPGAEGRRHPRLDGTGKDGGKLVDSDPEGLADAILSRKPYPVEILFLHNADPLHSSAAPARFAKALEGVPLTVSISAFPTDSALHADWILPEAHFLERWDLHTTPPGISFPLASISKPVLEHPLVDARSSAEIFLELAKRAGGDVASAFPASDPPALIRHDMDGIFAAQRGAVMGTAFDEAWVRMMEGAGWWAPGYRTAEELWKGALEFGGWWDPFYDHEEWARVLRTPSGRFEFKADLLDGIAKERAKTGTAEKENSTDLSLVIFEPLSIAGGFGAELPFLPALLDPGHEERWETWAEIHPETAKIHGLRDKGWVRVSSAGGSIVVRVVVTWRVVPGAVAIPAGLGKKGGGRWAKDMGANPFRLLGAARDPLSGLPDFQGTRVRLELAQGPETGPGALAAWRGSDSGLSGRELQNTRNFRS